MVKTTYLRRLRTKDWRLRLKRQEKVVKNELNKETTEKLKETQRGRNDLLWGRRWEWKLFWKSWNRASAWKKHWGVFPGGILDRIVKKLRRCVYTKRCNKDIRRKTIWGKSEVGFGSYRENEDNIWKKMDMKPRDEISSKLESLKRRILGD